ncbi:radical SAM/SPASM domain-containing protein [Geomonas sp. RF6]|uniref:radical SAM/SPASM domain-containing protein n=1 Tax=Geomonas sp. RF6 TaxID=2897342 RepID=UPI001E4E51E9|nr:radical SAM/SPASM domain-containing protein [Geomonas sp. RF6]UFS71448.1 radical SAM/SPASM domain-containing protein [Geomonas sp. RF6]
MTLQNWNRLADLCNGRIPSSAPVATAPLPPADAEGKAFRPHPSKLFVETTTYCNLQCSMCVKYTPGSDISEGHLSLETFKALEPLFPTAESLVLNGIGEPLLHPRLEEFVTIARASMPAESWIGFQSNGLLLTERRAVALMEAGLDRICISVDSVSPETFRAVREGGELHDVEKAFAVLTSAREKCGRRDFRIGMEFVLMRENMRELPAVLRWAASRGVDFAIVSHLLPYDPAAVDLVAYDRNTPEAVAIFESWMSRAEAEGIDISDYFRIAFQSGRSTEEEKRIIAHVQAMMADARARGIFLNVEMLLKRDGAWFAEVEKTFAAAREVAEELGLEITLPAAAPQDHRNCDFIENGSLFLAWDGKVHPCYFLWHKYACYLTNHKKYVSARSFGEVGEGAALEIWNGLEYRSFRAEVMRHEYPFCANCGLNPCEYLYCEEFEQDCYTNTVPCGDCFWAMGLFNCMR